MRLIVHIDQNPSGGHTMTRKKHNPDGKLLEALVSSDRDLLLELMRAALEEVLEAGMTEQFGASLPRFKSDRRQSSLAEICCAM